MANLKTFLGFGNFNTDFAAFRHFFGCLHLEAFSSTELFSYFVQHITTVIFLVILRNSAFPTEKPNLPRCPSNSDPEITKPFDFFHFFSKSRRNFELLKLPTNFIPHRKRVAKTRTKPVTLRKTIRLVLPETVPVRVLCRRTTRKSTLSRIGSALLLYAIMVVCE